MIKNKIQQNFHIKMLIDVRNILINFNIIPVLTGSALLGIIRNGDIIPWCNGVVLSVFSEKIDEETCKKIIKSLEKNGFEINKHFIKSENFKIRVIKDLFNVEIVGYARGKENYYRKLKNKIKIVPHEFFDDLDEIIFNDIKFNVPKNPKKFLSFIYKNWKVIDKSNSPSIYKSNEHMVFNK